MSKPKEMSELLFKLKKDGKTVGYLRIKEGKVWWQYTEYDKLTNACWYNVSTGKAIDFDTAHPFVCKDKNGKNVFKDDSVWFHWRGKKTKGKIIKDGLFWKYESAEKFNRTLCKFDLSHIELIEDSNA